LNFRLEAELDIEKRRFNEKNIELSQLSLAKSHCDHQLQDLTLQLQKEIHSKETLENEKGKELIDLKLQIVSLCDEKEKVCYDRKYRFIPKTANLFVSTPPKVVTQMKINENALTKSR
jgi:hypothetical protein